MEEHSREDSEVHYSVPALDWAGITGNLHSAINSLVDDITRSMEATQLTERVPLATASDVFGRRAPDPVVSEGPMTREEMQVEADALAEEDRFPFTSIGMATLAEANRRRRREGRNWLHTFTDGDVLVNDEGVVFVVLNAKHGVILHGDAIKHVSGYSFARKVGVARVRLHVHIDEQGVMLDDPGVLCVVTDNKKKGTPVREIDL